MAKRQKPKRKTTLKKQIKHTEKKKFGKEFWLGAFIAFLMISSVFGIMVGGFSQGSTTQNYKDYKFKTVNGVYVTKINSLDVAFPYVPQQVEYYNVSAEIISELMASEQIDLTSEFETISKTEIAATQLYFKDTIEGQGSAFVRTGYTEQTQYATQVITCDENSNSTVPTIVYMDGDETKVTKEGRCIVLMSSSNDGFRILTTRLLYGIFGVIQ